jgi:Raf kinase inhibitor-like YbhB/YbcL family protein
MGRPLQASVLPDLPSFEVLSRTIREGEILPPPQLSRFFSQEGGQDISPDLSWSGAPSHTKSYAVTMFGSDAPTGSGFWHWVVINIPAHVRGLPVGAGSEGGKLLPNGSTQLPNDIRAECYVGGAPKANARDYHYTFAVHALDIKKMDVPSYATAAYFLLEAEDHIIARAALTTVSSVQSPWLGRRPASVA